MALFSLMAKLGLDLADYDSGLKKAGKMTQESTSKMASDVKSAGASIAQHLGKFFTVAALSAGIKFMSDAAGKIVDLADAYDLTTEQIQRMEYAAAGTGVQLESLVDSVVKLGEARRKASDGDEKANQAFLRLGISTKDVRDKNLSNYDLLLKVGQASKNVAGTYGAQSAMADLLGSKSVKLTAAIRELNEQGPISLITNDELQRIDQATNRVEKFLKKLRNEAVGLGSFVLQFFEGTSLGDKAYEAARKRGLSDKQAREEYSRAFLSVMSGEELERIGGKLVPKQKGLPEGVARDAGEMFGPLQAGQTWDAFEKKPEVSKDGTARVSARSRFDRPSTGSLASIGGLYFGADYNTRLMSTAEKQVRELEKISQNTKDTSDKLSE